MMFFLSEIAEHGSYFLTEERYEVLRLGEYALVAVEFEAGVMAYH